MLFKESETVELKEIVTDDLKKEIIAFANCDGGKIYICVNDEGEAVGLNDADSTALQISNMVRDAIKPDLTMFVHYETIKENDKTILVLNVARGTDRPYFLAKKGMRPEGVYVRQSYCSAPASDSAIRYMIKETDGDDFETMRSLNQELTFNDAKKEFELRGLDFGHQQMRTLKLIDQDDLYTNLALLLSDQCLHTIKAAVFQSDQTVFKDQREFTGSLLKQMNDVYDYIDFHNHTQATIEKLLRIDRRDYPEVALREALLNLLVHRDYSFSASSLISIFSDRIEFVSVGGLMPKIELEDVMMGISICRNQNLANIFYRLHLIEAYGTGIKKIMAAYENSKVKPKIEVTKNAFKIILPNINSEYPSESDDEHKEDAGIEDIQKQPNDEEDMILKYTKDNGTITKNDVAALLGVSPSTAIRTIKKMIEQNLLKQEGKAKNTRYTLF